MRKAMRRAKMMSTAKAWRWRRLEGCAWREGMVGEVTAMTTDPTATDSNDETSTAMSD